MNENGELTADAVQAMSDVAVSSNQKLNSVDEAIGVGNIKLANTESGGSPLLNGEIRTLDGEIAGDEFASDSINYQILLGKIDALLDRLKLDA